MKETLTDYQGLFNCLRPDPQLSVAFDGQQDDIEPGTTCDYCKSYNGEIPVSRFKMRDHYTGMIEIIDLCADCMEEDHIFQNKDIMNVTKL